MIKAIIIDFGGVLMLEKKEYEGPAWLDVDQETWDKANIGEMPDDEVYDIVAKRHGVDKATVLKWLLGKREPNQGLIKLLGRLNPGIKKGIINNGHKTLFYGYLDKYDLRKIFDATTNSGEERVRKPDPDIYLRTCKRLGVKPSEAIFVDDAPRFVEGAEKLGMTAIRYTNVEDLESRLQAEGLLK